MVVDDPLKLRALRAYEIGRLRRAARALLLVIPVAILCAIETRQHETCGCLGAALVVTAVYLRWRSRDGAESVQIGAIAAAGPLAVALLANRAFPVLAVQHPVSAGAALFGAALVTGAFAGCRSGHRRPWTLEAAGALVVAMLLAALGCAGLGAGALGGAGAGLLVGGLGGRLATFRSS